MPPDDAERSPSDSEGARVEECIEVPGILDTSQKLVAEEGLEICVDFQGKTYTVAFAGDSQGIIRPEQR